MLASRNVHGSGLTGYSPSDEQVLKSLSIFLSLEVKVQGLESVGLIVFSCIRSGNGNVLYVIPVLSPR